MTRALHNKWVRNPLLFIFACLGILLGYLRWTYALIWDNGFRFVIRHTLYSSYNYPNNWKSLLESISTDPRWLSFCFYSVSAFLLSIAVIFVYYNKREYVLNTCIVYLIAWGIVMLFSVISLIFPFPAGLSLAQNIKHLLQTPFFTLLLLSGFKISEMKS